MDASALLAVLNREKGADLVIAHLRAAEVSIVNLCEVLVKAAENGADVDRTQQILDSFHFRTRAFREGHAMENARLRPLTRHLGLSFGDRACLVQARFSMMPVLTSDERMAKADVSVDIRLIR